MSSSNYGKKELNLWIRQNIKPRSTCLDVGACDGKYADMLSDWLTMDGIEIFEPNIRTHNLKTKYRVIIHGDITTFCYAHYDVVIFGDVIEHLTVEDAQMVLAYARAHADIIIVAVPFMWEQSAIYGNKWEEHIQSDLTPSVFSQRYEGFEPLIVGARYGYFVNVKKDKSE